MVRAHRAAVLVRRRNASWCRPDTPVTFRATSADAIHGFLIDGTNANTMLVPGFVSTVHDDASDRPGEHLMPCHEYCGIGPRGDVGARPGARPGGEFMAHGGRPAEAELCCTLASGSSSRISGSPSPRFGVALLLGEWQMFVRSPLHAWVSNPEHYYRSVTAHGTVMAYVLPTLVAMGFGYAISELALKRPLIGLRWAWAGFWLVVGRHRDGGGDVALGPARRCSTPSIRR